VDHNGVVGFNPYPGAARQRFVGLIDNARYHSAIYHNIGQASFLVSFVGFDSERVKLSRPDLVLVDVDDGFHR
jgi:hypothetical protein